MLERYEIIKVSDLEVIQLNHLYYLIYPIGEYIFVEKFVNIALKDFIPEHSYIIKNGAILGYLISFPINDSSVEAGYVGKLLDFYSELDSSFYKILMYLFEQFENVEFESKRQLIDG